VNLYQLFRFTINKATGIGEDNYVIQARLKAHVPEILPIAGRRIHVSYPGQLKQCRRCFGQGHINATCESEAKVDWLEYVNTLLKSGKFDPQLFEGWMQVLKANHPEYQENADLRDVIDFGRQNCPFQGSFQGRNSHPNSQVAQIRPNTADQGGPTQPQNQGYYQGNNFQRNSYQGNFPRSRGRFGRGRGRGRGRGQSFILQQY